MASLIRFSILAGVSSDRQAQDDRASIPDQIATCRRAIEHLGGVEIGCYTMDGYSRTGYDSLADAMSDIPPLRESIEAAARDEYDVLILDNLDRLGDLGQLVFTRFRKYRKQIYSARQSGRLYDPATYDPSQDESSVIAMHVEGILQSYRINKLQRGLKLGVRRRVEEGRFSRNFPMTYKRDRYTGELVRNEPLATLVVRLKDEYLKGKVLRELVDIANASGIPAPKGGSWHRSIIQRLLLNPFHAGKVFDGRFSHSGWKISPNTGQRIYKIVQREAPLLDGRHPPLWTFDEYLRMKQESYERHKMVPKSRAWNFSMLLICPKCGGRAWGQRGQYKCTPVHDGMIRLDRETADREIGLALVDALKNYQDSPPPAPREDTTGEAVTAVERAIARVQKGYEAELYTAAEAKEKIQNLRKQIASIEAGRETAQQEESRHARMLELRDRLLPELDELPAMLAERAPAENNRFLRDILSGIVVREDGYDFIWR